MTNTQRAQEIVVNQYSVYVDRAAAEKAKTLQAGAFKNVEAYKELQAAKAKAVKEVEDYELQAVKRDPEYKRWSILAATQAVRAYGKKYNVPSMCNETFLNSETFAKMIADHGQYLDTTARLASFVVKVHDSFNEGRTKVETFKPYSEAEQVALRSTVGLTVDGFTITAEYIEGVISRGK